MQHTNVQRIPSEQEQYEKEMKTKADKKADKIVAKFTKKEAKCVENDLKLKKKMLSAALKTTEYSASASTCILLNLEKNKEMDEKSKSNLEHAIGQYCERREDLKAIFPPQLITSLEKLIYDDVISVDKEKLKEKYHCRNKLKDKKKNIASGLRESESGLVKMALYHLKLTIGTIGLASPVFFLDAYLGIKLRQLKKDIKDIDNSIYIDGREEDLLRTMDSLSKTEKKLLERFISLSITVAASIILLDWENKDLLKLASHATTKPSNDVLSGSDSVYTSQNVHTMYQSPNVGSKEEKEEIQQSVDHGRNEEIEEDISKRNSFEYK